MNGLTKKLSPLIAVSAAVALCILQAVFFSATPACPFCLSPPQTLTEQIAQADIVVVAELIRFRVYDEGTRPESTLRIREYLRGEVFSRLRKELAVGQPVVIAAEAAGKTGDLFLLFGDLPESAPSRQGSTYASEDGPGAITPSGSPSGISTALFETQDDDDLIGMLQKTSLVIPELIAWNETMAVSKDAVGYLREIPARALPQRDRLEYFIPFLEHPDAFIAIDAWAEFGNSAYQDVVAVRDLMSPENLRHWIADPAMSPERLGLYGMMLGLCGSPLDAEFLIHQMQASDSVVVASKESVVSAPRFRFGAEGLMAGYLLLTADQGLNHLEETILGSSGISDTACHAFVQSLQFMWSYENDLISQHRLKQSMRLLLKTESMREIAITNLCRWEDWETLPILDAMFDTAGSNDQSTQKAIIQFARVCLKNQKAIEEGGPFAAEAEAFLSRVQVTHPSLMNSQVSEFRAPQ